MKKLAVLVAAVAAMVAQAGVAQAVTPSVVWIDGTTLRFLAAAGTTNTVTVQVDPGNPAQYLVTDTTNPVAARVPCVGVTPNSANCPVAGTTAVLVQLGDLNDSVTNRTTLPGALLGDAGNDRLNGGSAAETLDGGADTDFLDGGRGGDLLNGSAGTQDWALYSTRLAPVTVTLNNAVGDGEAGENDNVVGTENVQGGNGNDTLIGNAGPNNLIGGPGVDHLFGEPGNDILQGGIGAGDALSGGDGADFMDGGPDAGDLGDGDWNQDNVNDDGDADNCSAATEIQWSC